MLSVNFLDDMVEDELITQAQADDARTQADETGESLDQVLVNKGHLAERELLKFFSRHYGYDYYEKVEQFAVPEAFIERVPIAFARRYHLVAIGQEGGVYNVATCQPLNLHAMDDLSERLGYEVEPVLAPKSEIASLINKHYSENQAALGEALEDMGIDAFEVGGARSEDLLDVANKAPIIRLVNNILFRALKMRASDIHLHPFENKLQARYRIDGVLYDMEELPKKIQDAVITRVKVLGKMDIAERRLPQDGRASYTVGDNEVDLRISSIPTAYGERIVFRILDKSARLFLLDEIGVDSDTLTKMRRYIHAPNGIILVTGPTGSGKTTTLYAALHEINAAEQNILTIEDPIEYHLDGISQVQVSNKKGLTFAEGLRSFLRQDPDVMMVGEIRDTETAQIAIQAAQTGHLVFSTLHTNDSAGAVARMLDIGIEPFLVSSSVICVMAQRLVRLICNNCREKYKPDIAQLQELGMKQLPKDRMLWQGTGCEKCMGTGHWDRTGIYEIMEITESIRSLIVRRAGSNKIKQAALEDGIRTLRMDGIQKILSGQTTVKEVMAVTMMDI